jgi:hypothetical protein
MKAPAELACRRALRRQRLFANPDWNGIDYVEVSDDQLSLCVHFFGAVPELGVQQVTICGGRRVRGIRVLSVELREAHDIELDDCLQVRLDRFGDFSTYRLCLVDGDQIPAGIDPRYACAEFNFKVGCPADIDCAQPPHCEPALLPPPTLNYLAKDYGSFLQLIYDRLALTMPEWRERHAPDLGVTLVELLAYVADHLSYYQDAVATEAYLDTARLRISVRRHARLVDYRLHEGCNARAWISVDTPVDLEPLAPDNLYFITGYPELEGGGRVLQDSALELVPANWYEVFEPLVEDPAVPLHFRAAHSRIGFHTWGDEECCLPKGAMRATLADDDGSGGRLLDLHRGDVLVLAEVIGATTGNPADADPLRRQAVRLARVTPARDELLQVSVLEVEWGAEDALQFALCLSARLAAPDCRRINGISVALGNVVLVDHGRRRSRPLEPVEGRDTGGECACDGSVLESSVLPRPYTPALDGAPLTFSVPLPSAGPAPACEGATPASAAALARQDPRDAMPQVALNEFSDESAAGPRWSARFDLLESGPDERHFVAEIDDDGAAHLRFGDGDSGRQPPAGTRYTAHYRIGNGTSGNVGRDTIRYMVLRNGSLSAGAVQPSNPLAASGGSDAESMAEARLMAPQAFRARRQRAITAEDYAELAGRDPRIQRAAAELRWMGSWYEACVALDPFGVEHASGALCADIARMLRRYRRTGHDLAVVAARAVPLALTLQVCVQAHYAREQVRRALLGLMSNRRLADGTLGLFHPDRQSFGQPIAMSQLVAAIHAIPGVQTVAVLKLARLETPAPAGVPDNGVLAMGAFEIAILDNDPNFPENGKLELILKGGV